MLWLVVPILVFLLSYPCSYFLFLYLPFLLNIIFRRAMTEARLGWTLSSTSCHCFFLLLLFLILHSPPLPPSTSRRWTYTTISVCLCLSLPVSLNFPSSFTSFFFLSYTGIGCQWHLSLFLRFLLFSPNLLFVFIFIFIFFFIDLLFLSLFMHVFPVS